MICFRFKSDWIKGIKFKSGSGEKFFHTEHDGCGIGNQQNVAKNFFSEINGKCQIRVSKYTSKWC